MNSTNVLQFMNALFPSALKRYVKSIPCTMFLLCCGAVVRESVSFSELTGFGQPEDHEHQHQHEPRHDPQYEPQHEQASET